MNQVPNLPAIANLLGVNPAMTEEQTHDVRSLLQHEEHILARLNAEIHEATLLFEKPVADVRRRQRRGGRHDTWVGVSGFIVDQPV